ncbi:MAG: hypothetical protein VX475_23395 [Myxococcota bacterium]|nr:hypothetical protein [Myxococcota bacterium]
MNAIIFQTVCVAFISMLMREVFDKTLSRRIDQLLKFLVGTKGTDLDDERVFREARWEQLQKVPKEYRKAFRLWHMSLLLLFISLVCGVASLVSILSTIEHISVSTIASAKHNAFSFWLQIFMWLFASPRFFNILCF